LVRGHFAPGFKAALGGRQRIIQILARRVGDLADFRAGRRVDDIDALVTSGLAPFVVYQQKSVGITAHECSTGNVVIDLIDLSSPTGRGGRSENKYRRKRRPSNGLMNL